MKDSVKALTCALGIISSNCNFCKPFDWIVHVIRVEAFTQNLYCPR
jgi:hypothetical protein